MKKGVKGWSIVGITLIALWIIARVTGALQFYNIPSPSGEPNLPVNKKIFTSSLVKAKPGDLVVYTSSVTDSILLLFNTPGTKAGSHYIHRLCAIENDTIQMKDGIFYVNNKNFDTGINLYHFYRVSNNDMDLLKLTEEDYEKGNVIQQADTFTLVNITDEDIKKISPKITLVRYINNDFDPRSHSNPFAWHDQSVKWTADNFGPLPVPAGHGFVLGDNRHNSFDSRYAGFIKLKDIKGVKL